MANTHMLGHDREVLPMGRMFILRWCASFMTSHDWSSFLLRICFLVLSRQAFPSSSEEFSSKEGFI